MTPLTLPQVAELLGFKYGRVRGLADTKRLKTISYSTGAYKHRLVNPDDLLRFVKKNKFPDKVIKRVARKLKE